MNINVHYGGDGNNGSAKALMSAKLQSQRNHPADVGLSNNTSSVRRDDDFTS